VNAASPSYRTLVRVQLEAERSVATESPDHLMPWGTRLDNSRNRRFNQKLYKLFGYDRGPLWVLDLGCSGGGFVKDCLDDGCVAVGIEGSDFSKRYRRAEWRTIPEWLFTGDLTRRLQLLGEFTDGQRPLQFDVITAWEVIEHIGEADLPAVAENVKRHLSHGGLWILSASPNEEVIGGVRLHQTVQNRTWWIHRFHELGLFHQPQLVDYFNTQFVRGPKYGAPRSFHLALSPDPARAPVPPREGLGIRLYDRWLGGAPQRLLRTALLGV
jgi:2-polyprenyl-3-methyl-5-hydroxy-6-metoxy-1,4-benzoquinol methylase